MYLVVPYYGLSIMSVVALSEVVNTVNGKMLLVQLFLIKSLGILNTILNL